jgi:hypothetical protein
MKKNIISFILIMLMFSLPFSIVVSAGSEEYPEIDDEEDIDVMNYLDIISAWFFEKEGEPDFLYTSLKIKEISPIHMKQHLTVHWEYNGISCASGMIIGYGDPWFAYTAGYGHGWWFQEHYEEITGEYNEETGIITCKIPKSIINNPQKGEVLKNTYASTFERFGFIGRLGFGRPLIQIILFKISGKNIFDYAPETEDFGRDYTIQY